VLAMERGTGIRRTRVFLAVEVIVFAAASAVHSGLLVGGYRHEEARIAEAVIATVLLGGLVVTLVRPGLTRQAGLFAQGFALLGTLVGLFTIIVGVGPRTVPDVILHSGLVILLTWGLASVRRMPADRTLPVGEGS
jgi:hypothetical protein